ncbi:MAG TPA: AraC family transcriptional regulator [Lachnospiraceae bacterium]|nr:AraC family transcriptional regulator [Lachnospiraceae bacterium]
MTTIYYIGYDTSHPSNFVFDVPEGHDCWLLVITQTPALFWVDGEMKEYPAGYAILYPPHHKILYQACADTYTNDWVRFDTTESYVVESTLPFGVPFRVHNTEYCQKLFQLLSTENLLANDYRELTIDYLFRILFNKLIESNHHHQNSQQYQNLLDLRRAIHNNPGYRWTVPAMADYLHLSQGYLQSLYRSNFGISCTKDVINCRISLAKELLIHGSHTINEISVLCGYANMEHFCRQFRKATGYTPRDFRKLVPD